MEEWRKDWWEPSDGMTVAELIKALSALPQDSRISCVWDGAARTPVKVVWLARSGDVLIAGVGDVVYSDCDRPASAPTEAEDPHWETSL